MSIGLGWNAFQIRLYNVDSGIRPVVYTLRFHRNPRVSNTHPFPLTSSNHLSVCFLRQVNLTQNRTSIDITIKFHLFPSLDWLLENR